MPSDPVFNTVTITGGLSAPNVLPEVGVAAVWAYGVSATNAVVTSGLPVVFESADISSTADMLYNGFGVFTLGRQGLYLVSYHVWVTQAASFGLLIPGESFLPQSIGVAPTNNSVATCTTVINVAANTNIALVPRINTVVEQGTGTIGVQPGDSTAACSIVYLGSPLA